jgi:hypothetical protein
MIEETAAAGGRLAQEAVALAELIDEFTFSETEETEFLYPHEDGGNHSYPNRHALAGVAE